MGGLNDDIDAAAALAQQRGRIADDLRRAAQPDAPAADDAPDDAPEGGERGIAAPHIKRDRSEVFKRDRSWFQTQARMQCNVARQDEIDALRFADEAARVEMEKRDLDMTDTDGVELVPPIYLQDRYRGAAIAAAPELELVQNLPLPAGARTVTIPIGTTIVTVANHSENQTIEETDAQFDDKTATVFHPMGLNDMSIELHERAQPGLDGILMGQFGKVLAKHIGSAVLDGPGSGDSTGMLTAVSTNAVTFDDTTATFAEAYPKIADAIQRIIVNGSVAPNAVVVHPRRASKWFSELDNSNRPLAVPVPHGAQNALAVSPGGNGAPVAAGYTGYHIQGVAVYQSAQIPTTDGAGTNEDAVLIGDLSEMLLWRSMPIFEVDRSVGFKTGSVTMRARQAYAFLPTHAEKSLAAVTGTGLTTPSF